MDEMRTKTGKVSTNTDPDAPRPDRLAVDPDFVRMVDELIESNRSILDRLADQ